MSSGPSAKPTQMTFSAPSSAQPTKSSSEKPVLYPGESDKITLPTEKVELEDPGVTGKRAERVGGLQMKVMAVVIAVAIIVVAGMVAVFIILKKR